MFHTGFISIAFLAFVAFTVAQRFPSNLQRCAYNDQQCQIRVLQGILRKHSKGIQELGIIPFDPLHITSLSIKKIPNSPVSIDLKLKDGNFVGLSKASVIRVSGFEKHAGNMQFNLEIKVPKLVLSGMYDIDGQVISLPITGKGKVAAIFTDGILSSKVRCNSKDKKYLNIQSVEVDFKPGHVKYNFQNLFGGDKTLGDKMNSFLNENWDLVFSELQPLVDEFFAKILQHIASGPFSKVSYSELFL